MFFYSTFGTKHTRDIVRSPSNVDMVAKYSCPLLGSHLRPIKRSRIRYAMYTLHPTAVPPHVQRGIVCQILGAARAFRQIGHVKFWAAVGPPCQIWDGSRAHLVGPTAC